MKIIAGALAVIYVTYTACYATIMDEPRSRLLHVRYVRDVLACPLCFGFWASILVSLLPSAIVSVLALAGSNFIFWSLVEKE